MADLGRTIADMDPAIPGVNDPVGAGDDEIRAVKDMLQKQFPGDEAPGSVDWTAAPLPDRTADVYDTPVLVGPRTINALPGAIQDLDERLIVIEETPAISADRYLPTGIICMWSGSTASIPDRWALCDGVTPGTPDLRSRFIVGAGLAGAQYEIGETGGAEITQGLATSLSGGTHSHTITVAGTALTEAQMPAHGHPWIGLSNTQSTVGGGNPVGGIITGSGTTVTRAANTGAPSTAAGMQIGGVTGGGATHTHSASETEHTGHTHQTDVRPPWYALAFIMYMGPAAP